jgi:hypothetical protein
VEAELAATFRESKGGPRPSTVRRMRTLGRIREDDLPATIAQTDGTFMVQDHPLDRLPCVRGLDSFPSVLHAAARYHQIGEGGEP